MNWKKSSRRLLFSPPSEESWLLPTLRSGSACHLGGVFSKWLLFGILIRLCLMPVTAHSDIWALNFGQYFFAFKGVFNIYDYLARLSPTHSLVQNYGANFFTYPPLAYFTLGLFGLILRPLSDHAFTPWLIANFSQVYQNDGVFKQLFLLKLPYLLFDLSLAFFLSSLFKEKKKQKIAFLLWLFNPLTFYTTFMIGQFDIIPVFFTVLALWLVIKGKDKWGAVTLGIGGAFKMFPLFFLLPLVLVVEKKFRKRIGLLVLGALPYFLTIIPFLSSAVFRQVVLFSSQSEKMLFARLPVSGAEGVYLFVFFYVLICFFTDYWGVERESLWVSFLAVLLLFFSLTHYHPQWFLWLTPFLVIDLVVNGRKQLSYIVLLFFCSSVLLFFFESSLHFGLFAPIFPSLAQASGGLGEVVAPFYDPFQFKSIIRSLLAATAAFLVYLNFRYGPIKRD